MVVSKRFGFRVFKKVVIGASFRRVLPQILCQSEGEISPSRIAGLYPHR
jgi:hypothetical protein